MLPGPVFAFELRMTARRGRFYAARALYATVLLVILWSVHAGWNSAYDGELPQRMIAWFGFSAFAAIVLGQGVLVLLLTPALVAGAIADEKRRKTLHYLLASQLTGPEIVIGKLMVRMLYAGVLLGVSLPVMSLLVLLGGLDPALVLLGCGGLLSLAWFLSTQSIWVSTIARRPREALFVTFGLEVLWLLVPHLVRANVAGGWPVGEAVLWLSDWVEASSPTGLGYDLFVSLFTAAPTPWVESLGWMIGLQAAFGVVLALLAAVQLRPIFKRQDGAVAGPRGLRAILAARRLRSLPPIGDRPMLWKELHTGGARGFARVIGWLLTVILGGLLFYYGAWYGLMAFLEMWELGYLRGLGWQLGGQERWKFFLLLKTVTPLLYLVWTLAIAGAAASSITSEHEDDTWTSLTGTDLTGREIVWAKLFGALWRARRLASILLLFLVTGIGVGSIHALSLPLMALALAVYGWFAAALGVWISLLLRSTWRAQFLTIALLLLVNVAGQGTVNMLAPHGFAPQDWPGFTPYEVDKLVMEPGIVQTLQAAQWPRFWRLWDIDDGPGWLATFSVMSLVGYAVLAALLTRDALQRFEIVAGRARRGAAASGPLTESSEGARPEPRPPGISARLDPA
jgi:ABC-type transport system involved in multi-copper enzyme maturation permease subunit